MWITNTSDKTKCEECGISLEALSLENKSQFCPECEVLIDENMRLEIEKEEE